MNNLDNLFDKNLIMKRNRNEDDLDDFDDWGSPQIKQKPV